MTGDITTNSLIDGRNVSADGTKLDGIATSANNYSHPANHAISVITGLQTALDGKVDDSQVLTNVPSGALFTDTNTTYSAGTGMSLSGTTFNCNIDSPGEVGLGNLSNSGNNLAGDFTATGNVTAYSDARLKDNIETIDGALDKVCAMRGVMFDKDGKRETGVIAQEVQEVLPEAVMQNEEYLSVAYGNMVGVLIEAVKELKAEIEVLKGK